MINEENIKLYGTIALISVDNPASSALMYIMQFVVDVLLTNGPFFFFTSCCITHLVDDTCVALLPSMVESYHQHLNSIEPSIQFTVEMESNGCLPFLDILITRDSDGSLSTAVYRKQTHTDQYLQFSSHHPSSHKLSVCRSLFSRALTHSSSLVQQVEEESLIFQALQKNGYPINFIKRIYPKNKTT